MGTVSGKLSRSQRGTGVQYEPRLNLRTKERLLRIVHKAGRRPSAPIMWLAETAMRDGLLDNALPGTQVRDAHRGSPRILFWAPPIWYKYFVDRSWELEIYKDSAPQLLGLCIERQLARKRDEHWIDFFQTGSDILDRIFQIA